MTVRRKLVSFVSVSAAFALLSVTSFAQEAGKKGDEQERQRTAPTTMTGCLSKSDTAGQYSFTDSSTGAKKNVVPSSGVDLDKHAANHTVKLTGTVSQDGQTFTATEVEHVSATCQATK